MAKRLTINDKYLGPEPVWVEQPTDEDRLSAVSHAFSWYNYFNSHKDAKIMIVAFLIKNKRNKEAKLIKKVPDGKIKTPYAWMTKMILNGFELNEVEEANLEKEFDRLKDIASKSKEIPEEKKLKHNVQDIMKEKALEVGGELEGMLDDLIADGVPHKHKLTPINLLKASTMLPQHVPMLVEIWESSKDTYIEIQRGNDKELVEAYSHFSKIQIRNLIKFCDLVISNLHSYVVYKKSIRVKRKKNPISVERLVMKLKYQKKSEELNLTSIKPCKIPGSKEMYVYDTRKRKLHYYVEDPHADGLSVKNNAIVGFDVVNSLCKTLRDPVKQVNQLMKASVLNARKFYKNIKTVDIKLSGRFDKSFVILRVH